MISQADHLASDVATRAPLVPLSSLRAGCRATLHRRCIEGEESEVLNAMGLTESCRLRVCRMGEPCIVQIASTRLGLSAAVASRILVTIADDVSAATPAI